MQTPLSVPILPGVGFTGAAAAQVTVSPVAGVLADQGTLFADYLLDASAAGAVLTTDANDASPAAHPLPAGRAAPDGVMGDAIVSDRPAEQRGWVRGIVGDARSDRPRRASGKEPSPEVALSGADPLPELGQDPVAVRARGRSVRMAVAFGPDAKGPRIFVPNHLVTGISRPTMAVGETTGQRGIGLSDEEAEQPECQIDDLDEPLIMLPLPTEPTAPPDPVVAVGDENGQAKQRAAAPLLPTPVGDRVPVLSSPATDAPDTPVPSAVAPDGWPREGGHRDGAAEDVCPPMSKPATVEAGEQWTTPQYAMAPRAARADHSEPGLPTAIAARDPTRFRGDLPSLAPPESPPHTGLRAMERIDLADPTAAPSQPVDSGSTPVNAGGTAAVVSGEAVNRLISAGAESMQVSSTALVVTSPPASAALPQPRPVMAPDRPIVWLEEMQRESPDVASTTTHRLEQRDGRAHDDPRGASSRPLAEVAPVTAHQPVPVHNPPSPEASTKTFVADDDIMSPRIPTMPVRRPAETPVDTATEPAERRSDAQRDHNATVALEAEVPAVMAPGADRPAPPAGSPPTPLASPVTSGQAATPPEIVQHPRRQLQAALLATQTGADGSRQVRLDLRPETLGSMQVHIVQAAGAPARVMIAVSEPDTLALLRGDVPALHAALDQAGIPFEGRSLSLSLVPSASEGSPLAKPETAKPGTDGNTSAPSAPLSLTGGDDTTAGFGAGSGHQTPHHRSLAALASSYGPQAFAGDEVPILSSPATPRHARVRDGLDITA